LAMGFQERLQDRQSFLNLNAHFANPIVASFYLIPFVHKLKNHNCLSSKICLMWFNFV